MNRLQRIQLWTSSLECDDAGALLVGVLVPVATDLALVRFGCLCASRRRTGHFRFSWSMDAHTSALVVHRLDRF